MQLSEYLKAHGPATRKALEQHLGISKSYLSQLASGKSSISPARCILIEIFTRGVVSRAEMRPSDWSGIWPNYKPNHNATPLEGSD
ncbi:YdaS family helix-turn-helix protein [Enterobacter ludwigii]